ncbi:hypothetical protein BY996DRAFT_6430040 [Phakopsora pachyrhizi]|nr:hypothetical protein BY996DRAFT_6430040 [Phakopsora pachyrhizi]
MASLLSLTNTKNHLKNRQQVFPPDPKSFIRGIKPRESDNSEDQLQTSNLTELRFDSPDHLKKQAYEMYNRSKLSNHDPVTRLAILRQMRNLDLPPHRMLWQSIEPKHELSLLRWTDQAFGQLLYQKRLWKPSHDWGIEDDRQEEEMRLKNLEILRSGYEEQILGPLKDMYGPSEVTVAISNLSKEQQLYCEPAIVWETGDPETGKNVLEWMSEYTADVVWPGLVRCKAEYQIARRYWEAEAREFSRSRGGVPMGLGTDGECLEMETDEERRERLELTNKTFKGSGGQSFDEIPRKPSDFQSQEIRNISESILIKQYLSQRSSSKSDKKQKKYKKKL